MIAKPHKQDKGKQEACVNLMIGFKGLVFSKSMQGKPFWQLTPLKEH